MNVLSNLFLVWTKYQARAESLVPDLNEKIGHFKVVYRDNSNPNKIKKIANYLSFFIKDVILLYKEKPKVVIVQTPPSFSLFAPICYKFFSKKLTIVSDTHNAMTREPWSSRVGSKSSLKLVDFICVHNNTIYKTVIQNELYKQSKTLILEDKTLELQRNDNVLKNVNSSSNSIQYNTINVFFPASFNMDEPILEVIACARENKDIIFNLTGNIQKLEINFNLKITDLPDNLNIMGWISNEEYLKKLNDCDILLGLTIFDDIQMSVSNEGLGAEKVMVLSNKKTLKDIYKSAAIYTDHTPDSLSESIRKAYKKQSELLEKVVEVKNEKNQRYNLQLEKFALNVNGGN